MYSTKSYWAKHPYAQSSDPKLKEHLKRKAERSREKGIVFSTREFRDFLDWCDESTAYAGMSTNDIREVNNSLAALFGFTYNGVNQFYNGDPDFIYSKLIELYPRLSGIDSYYHIKRQYNNEMYEKSLQRRLG